MSIDDRLRTGLSANTEHLVPNLELELASTLRRAHRRRQLRMAGVAVAAAGVAAVAWLTGLTDLNRSGPPHEPVETPVEIVSPTDMDGISGPLDPGTYSMPLWGSEGRTLPRAQIEVPEGYFSNGGYVVDAGNSTTEPDEWGEVAVWRVEHIVIDPCHADGYSDIGSSVRALARALTRQPSQQTTAPRSVTLNGYRGLYLEVTSTLSELELGACSYGIHALWHTGPATDRAYGQDRPGVTNHLWILDVDGTRLVIAVSNYPDQTEAQRQQLLDIAKTIHFIAP